ncbi:MAG TPA: TIGR02444 family protein [Pseudolabrys sp.]
MTIQTENLFWHFSVAVYSAPQVADECISLQDRFGVDVNVLLFAAWIGVDRRLILTADHLAMVDAAVSEWQDSVIVPVRAVRRRLKTMEPSVYEKAKAIELELEQIEQARLYHLASQLHGQEAVAAEQAIRANISLCLARKVLGAVPEALIAAAIAYC